MEKVTKEQVCDGQNVDLATAVAQTRLALGLLSGKWCLEILFILVGGARRFGELKRAIPDITQHMLTARLRELEGNGLVTRTVFAEVPPRVEYELTPAAMAIRPVFEALLKWAQTHQSQLRAAA
jgi:DNA-binding HxlR family transcriptional regulator